MGDGEKERRNKGPETQTERLRPEETQTKGLQLSWSNNELY